MEETCTHCGNHFFEEGGFGFNFCVTCGLGRTVPLVATFSHDQEGIPGQHSYTRIKRFKKYLSRASRQQSSATVPQETWDYLLQRAPFRGPKDIQRTLKRAKNIKRKCYDSLPFLTASLCPHITVPILTEGEKKRALEMFREIDLAIKYGPFISYLFCLEYILKKMQRQDICAYINQIQCTKRRRDYTERLDKIFSDAPCTFDTVKSLLHRPA